ncbi:SDR family NAD(P)-dependent oxidoreductase [Roseomonas sp. M0104]|uniref:SDR family NAD(P)-dependent oxidoreductase n=1 Tax=Teichococcus coralli TaxID=2545983 RepID=A0A845BDL4_9PROT|nr:SDR family NAD(P)-dependent oxidoreductase [Pseudoroseomonas coralli]MXP64200.1 SDR family NAD(P)-dependent oxidoreductase [Pseudoroseomonas coralli]
MRRVFRSVVITGASRGLGAALARRFAAPGVTLGLIGRDRAALEAVAADCAARGAAPRTGVRDVRDAAGMAALLEAWERTAPVDLAIANAGIAAGTRPDGAPEGLAAARAQVEVNLLGALNLLDPLLPGMRRRGTGAVGLVASLAAFRGLPDSPGYCASKAGLWAYGEALRAGLAPEGVRVTLVAPGFFDSAMGARWVGPRPLSLSADAAAARVEGALRRGAAQCVFPWPLGWALRLAPLLPARTVDAVVRRMAFQVRGE